MEEELDEVGDDITCMYLLLQLALLEYPIPQRHPSRTDNATFPMPSIEYLTGY